MSEAFSWLTSGEVKARALTQEEPRRALTLVPSGAARTNRDDLKPVVDAENVQKVTVRMNHLTIICLLLFDLLIIQVCFTLLL